MLANFFALFRNGEKNLIIRSSDLDFGPITLKFNRVRAIITIHVQAKLYQVECSGS